MVAPSWWCVGQTSPPSVKPYGSGRCSCHSRQWCSQSGYSLWCTCRNCRESWHPCWASAVWPSGRLPDGVCVVGPGQVITDVDPEEPEAADSLHRSPVDGEGGVFYSLSLPVVHNQHLPFADVEMEVVVLAQRCQGSDLTFTSYSDQMFLLSNPM